MTTPLNDNEELITLAFEFTNPDQPALLNYKIFDKHTGNQYACVSVIRNPDDGEESVVFKDNQNDRLIAKVPLCNGKATVIDFYNPDWQIREKGLLCCKKYSRSFLTLSFVSN